VHAGVSRADEVRGRPGPRASRPRFGARAAGSQTRAAGHRAVRPRRARNPAGDRGGRLQWLARAGDRLQTGGNGDAGSRGAAEGVGILMVGTSTMTPSLAASYQLCEEIARREAANFYPAFRLLPGPQRRAMCALYAFLRIADDLGDADLPAELRRTNLDDW